jgi:hypothetical protein
MEGSFMNEFLAGLVVLGVVGGLIWLMNRKPEPGLDSAARRTDGTYAQLGEGYSLGASEEAAMSGRHRKK